MENERCHVTVVGARRRVDLAVPADAAIAGYLPALLELVGQSEFDETFPPVWSLARAQGPLFPPESSLRESGVVDGATLYLRDVAAGEFDEPVVTDLQETVESTSGGMAVWGRQARAHTTLLLAVLGIVAAFAALAWTGLIKPVTGSGAVGAALALALLAWYATHREWSLRPRLRLVLALAAVPLLAVAAAVFPAVDTSTSSVLVAISAGSALGGVAAVLAVRHPATLMTAAGTGVLLLLTVCLVLGDADPRESSAVVAVVMMVLLSLAPKVSGHVAVLSGPRPAAGDTLDDEAEVRRLVRRGRRLLVAANTGVSALTAVCLVMLAVCEDAFAVALAVCLGLALVLRAGQTTVAPAAVPMVAAGTAGLAAALIRAPGNFGAPQWAGAVALLGAAMVALALGLNRAFGAEGTGDRPAWLDPFSGFLLVLSLPLVVGVFGVYASLLDTGPTP
ncbi:type VII secretion integral membrane protein EccD [Streptomyces sp. NPDC023723]|uniref:type VII secretion integral membrane protein EccD n=1 Tax=Streptomyces sp. NPDC023723 TaxID=3154323 RepID=UPI0033D711DD